MKRPDRLLWVAGLTLLAGGCDFWYNRVPSPDDLWHVIPWFDHMIRAKYELELPRKDLILIVGTMAAHPKTFVVIGLVYPPRSKVDGVNVQQTLDLMGEQGAMTGVGVGLEAQEAGTLGSDERQDALKLFPDET